MEYGNKNGKRRKCVKEIARRYQGKRLVMTMNFCCDV